MNKMHCILYVMIKNKKCIVFIIYSRSFKLLPMPPHLDPVKLQRHTDSSKSGPFIFAPQSYGHSDKENKTHVGKFYTCIHPK